MWWLKAKWMLLLFYNFVCAVINLITNTYANSFCLFVVMSKICHKNETCLQVLTWINLIYVNLVKTLTLDLKFQNIFNLGGNGKYCMFQNRSHKATNTLVQCAAQHECRLQIKRTFIRPMHWIKKKLEFRTKCNLFKKCTRTSFCVLH